MDRISDDSMSGKPVVFVSCGQCTEPERRLGRDICALLRELRPDMEPYFAQEQSDVKGLSNHILSVLFRSAGFICVMHRRGDISTPAGKVTRGSLWIEQEIAIAAFMEHTLGRSIPVFFYKQAGVSLEGIRSVLHMNPRVEFTQESQILDNLRTQLPVAIFPPYLDYDLIAIPSHREVGIDGNRHVYMFAVDVKNVGRQRITDFQLRVSFPRAFLNPNIGRGSEDQRRSTKTHICLVIDEKNRGQGVLYPGDGLRNPLTFDYFVDDDVFDSPDAMRSEILIELFSGSMTPRKWTLRIADYQHF